MAPKHCWGDLVVEISSRSFEAMIWVPTRQGGALAAGFPGHPLHVLEGGIQEVDILFKYKKTVGPEKGLDGITWIKRIKIAEFRSFFDFKNLLPAIVDDLVVPDPENYFCHMIVPLFGWSMVIALHQRGSAMAVPAGIKNSKRRSGLERTCPGISLRAKFPRTSGFIFLQGVKTLSNSPACFDRVVIQHLGVKSINCMKLLATYTKITCPSSFDPVFSIRAAGCVAKSYNAWVGPIDILYPSKSNQELTI